MRNGRSTTELYAQRVEAVRRAADDDVRHELAPAKRVCLHERCRDADETDRAEHDGDDHAAAEQLVGRAVDVENGQRDRAARHGDAVDGDGRVARDDLLVNAEHVTEARGLLKVHLHLLLLCVATQLAELHQLVGTAILRAVGTAELRLHIHFVRGVGTRHCSVLEGI